MVTHKNSWFSSCMSCQAFSNRKRQRLPTTTFSCKRDLCVPFYSQSTTLYSKTAKIPPNVLNKIEISQREANKGDRVNEFLRNSAGGDEQCPFAG